jgi:hypothetical protein
MEYKQCYYDFINMAPEGFEVISGASLYLAAQRLLRMLYPTKRPAKPKKKDEIARELRNDEIRRRYQAGERVVDLAKEYSMTLQGIYRILRKE